MEGPYSCPTLLWLPFNHHPYILGHRTFPQCMTDYFLCLTTYCTRWINGHFPTSKVSMCWEDIGACSIQSFGPLAVFVTSIACSKVFCPPVPVSAQPRPPGSFVEQPDLLFLRWIDVLCFPSSKSNPGPVCYWARWRWRVSLAFSIAWFISQLGPPLSLKCRRLVWKVGGGVATY